jgi:hypothetical protein
VTAVVAASTVPWMGLAPGLAPLLIAGRLAGKLPHPWASRKNTVWNTLALIALSPLLVPACLASFTLLAWPIHRDYQMYIAATGEAVGELAAQVQASTGEKHDWRKWLNSRWVQSFGWLDVTDASLLPLLKDAVRADPVGYLNRSLPARQGERPLMIRGQPHRQRNQVDEVSAKIASSLHREVFSSGEGEQAWPWLGQAVDGRQGCEHVGVPSLFEGTGAASLRFNEAEICGCAPAVKSRKGEWAHVHNADGSWHMLLAPADVVAVVGAGWGEVWPAAALGWVRRRF